MARAHLLRATKVWVVASSFAATLLVALTGQCQTTSSPPVDFTREIRPLLVRYCISCHGPDQAKSGLRLDSREAALKGGKSGKAVIVPGAASKSELTHRILTQDPDDLMPPKGGRLTSAQAGVLQRWIEQGAVWPETRDAKHWAFVPPLRPAVPAVKNKNWTRNPIDHFVLAKLEERGWQPSPRAEPRVLLRRVALDLTGLPPTLEEQEQFARNLSPDAFAKLVDELLSRTAYGERWGRHWLDLARYGETNGYERDAVKPSVWRYRDYVIAAFNHDKPYDRFIREQIAGDELPDASAETLVATGFLRLGPWDDEPADPLQDRADQIDDMIRATSQTFLGLTLGCARCHDHKFDPLTARDYYSMAAMFTPLQRKQSGRSDLDAPAGSRAELKALAERDRKLDALTKEKEAIRKASVDEYLATGKSKLPAEAVAAFRAEAKKPKTEQKELIKQFTPQLETELKGAMPMTAKESIKRLDEAIAALRRTTPDLPRGYFPFEPTPEPPPTHVLLRGSAQSLGPEVFAAVPVALTPKQPDFKRPDEFTSRRRTVLADWMASPDNPLTARVIVNRVWQHHFGEGLVSTPSNFGLIGMPPTHPELLDWLADWFVKEGGWSLKKLHRLILSSATWQQGSGQRQVIGNQYPVISGKPHKAIDAARSSKLIASPRITDYSPPDTADPENQLLWHFPYRRLEVEAIRDSMLAVSGQLNPQVGGPSMYPEVPRAALLGSSDPDKIWRPFVEKDASRRTVYAFVKRSFIVPMLEVLDVCDSTQSSEKRSVTSIAPQALTLFNGDFVNRQARHFAERLQREAGADSAKQIELAWRLALCRPPTAAEVTSMGRYLAEETTGQIKDAAAQGKVLSPDEAAKSALVQLCRAVLNLNEFVYPD